MSEQQPQPQEQVRIRKKRYRKKKRWPKVLLWTLSIVVVLGVGGLFAANYAIDKFLEQMVAEIDMGELTADTGGNDKPSGGIEPTGGGGQGEGTTPGAEPGEGATGRDNNGGGTPATEGGGASGKDLDGYSAEITPDKAQHVQDSVTLSEKSRVASILLGQLSMEDIKRLQELSSGGLSLEEKREAKRLILEKLTPEQYDEIIEVAKNYGLSEGKSYADSKKEDLTGS
ncbi:hypothetical protein PA598K_01878 [Paenibacillus sp. 598K]|uniref:hypothetical protein n=1 Tax=Paenibacillus sp. 598K TaxID=1117987 RepID=UPI000FF9E658|nr:hypothetical protein [Paenibacillus sp. 598K]GBF73576.1 hypothetical protein PA598K_01878 [Paenibacillus sp. 598K]